MEFWDNRETLVDWLHLDDWLNFFRNEMREKLWSWKWAKWEWKRKREKSEPSLQSWVKCWPSNMIHMQCIFLFLFRFFPFFLFLFSAPAHCPHITFAVFIQEKGKKRRRKLLIFYWYGFSSNLPKLQHMYCIRFTNYTFLQCIRPTLAYSLLFLPSAAKLSGRYTRFGEKLHRSDALAKRWLHFLTALAVLPAYTSITRLVV